MVLWDSASGSYVPSFVLGSKISPALQDQTFWQRKEVLNAFLNPIEKMVSPRTL